MVELQFYYYELKQRIQICIIYQNFYIQSLFDSQGMKGTENEKYIQKMKGKNNRRKHLRQKSLTKQIGQYEIDLDSVIGKGAFGQVYKAHKIGSNDECFACKHINEKKLSGMEVYGQNQGKTNKERLQQEIAAHKSLMEAEHVVKLYDVKEEKDGYYLFMEMCDIDLGKFIKEKGRLSETQAMDLFRQLIQGYDSLYELNISHRDLKPQNLLLLDKVLKISDFGFVKVNENLQMQSRSGKKSRFMAQSLVGSINYMAPDILVSQLQNKPYNPFKSDIWSMGIILYKMLFGKQPYHGSSTVELLQQIKTQDLVFPSQIQVSEEVIALLKRMIERDQKARIGFKSLKQHMIKENIQKDDCKMKKKWPTKPTIKEKYLIFYNTLMIQLSFDSANYATLREIGMQDYQKISSTLMTIIHQKRIDLLESTEDKDVFSDIKDEIASYNNTFYMAIKENAEMQGDSEKTLMKLLNEFSNLLKKYEDFEYFLRSVQFFLLNMLLMYNLQKKFVTVDYIYMILNKEDKIKNFDKLKKDNFRQ